MSAFFSTSSSLAIEAVADEVGYENAVFQPPVPASASLTLAQYRKRLEQCTPA